MNETDERAQELQRMAFNLYQQKAYASRIWEHQQLAKRLVKEGKLTQEQCDRIIELSGGEITRI